MKILMKPSSYNFYFKSDNGDYYIYNSLSDSLMKANKYLSQLLKKGRPFPATEITEEQIEILTKHYIIVKNEFSEINELNKNFNIISNNPNSANLTVYLSMNCNLACTYCIQKGTDETITKSDTIKLKKFITNNCSELKYNSITWSGGEPLLYWDRIKQLSKTFIAICDKNDTTYSSDIVTNGVLITEKIAKDFLDCKIKNVQITLDGISSIHNQRRVSKNGKGTFNKTLQGIKIASKYINVIVRVNIDKENKDHIHELLKVLKKYDLPKERIRISFKPVISGLNNVMTKNLFCNEEFSQLEVQLHLLAKTYGFKTTLYRQKSNSLRCAYYHDKSFHIGPDLLLYKCAELVGFKEFAIGEINNSDDIHTFKIPTDIKVSGFNPFDNKECTSCKVLPLCMGKCPITYENFNCKEGEGCTSAKYNTCERVILQNNLKIKISEEAQNP